MAGTPEDEWSSGDAYEAYIGRWSRPVARAFVRWLNIRPQLRWLDLGCGTGALTGAIVHEADPETVLGIDASAAYVDAAQRRVHDRRVRFEEGDAATLDLEKDVDVVASGLVLNFLADPAAVVAAMARAVTDRGVVATYVWDYAGRMELLRRFWDAAGELDPGARALDEGARFPLCDPARLAELCVDAVLVSVDTTAIDVPTVFGDFDDFWAPFLGGQGPAPGYVRSRSDAERDALRDAIRASLPIAADGSISLIARAWAVRGRAATRAR